MRVRSAYWQLRAHTRLISVRQGQLTRQFASALRLHNDTVTYQAPGPEQEPPQPKATIRSRLWAFVIGSGAALAYAAYKRRNAQIKPPEQAKTSDGFAKFTLVDKDEVSSTCSIFTLKPLSSRLVTGAQVNADGGIYSVQLKQPQLQIARSYTMLPPIPGEPIDTLRLLIRKEEKGEVSGYLHTLPIGSDIEVRGPYKDFAFPKDTQQVLFLAGGTGIAPALKTADALSKTANVHILWASRSREDCTGGVSDEPGQQSMWSSITSLWSSPVAPPVRSQDRNTMVLLLDLLKQQQANAGSADNLKIDYFVDEEHTHIRPSNISALLKRTRDKATGSKLLLISGPEGFINHWAGPKQFINGREEQGELSGALSRMNLHGWLVVKL